MNGPAVQDLTIRAGRADRAEQARRGQRAMDRSSKVWRAAERWVRERMPEADEGGLGGTHPLVVGCALAVRAGLERRQGGMVQAGQVTPEAVRARLLTRFPEAHAELYGTTTTTTEVA